MINNDIQKLSMQDLLALILKETPDSNTVIELYSLLKDPKAFLTSESNDSNIQKTVELQVKAGVELGRRVYSSPPYQRQSILCAKDAANLLMPELRYLDREYFKVILLDRKLHFLGMETVSVGGVSSTFLYPRECFVAAIRRNAAGMILAHNHPSDDPTPSAEDIEVTKQLKEAGKLLGINIIDHIVIGDGNWISLNDLGLI